jgi:predicted DNA-binding ribbon-helix-helix protein
MRTTLVIDDDVHEAVRAMARSRQMSLGQVISDLMRRELSAAGLATEMRARNGVPLLSKRGARRRVTPEVIRRLDNNLSHERVTQYRSEWRATAQRGKRD